MGYAYKSIHSARPFRDSVTDATNGVGQLLMTGLYREQWIFWDCDQPLQYLPLVGRKHPYSGNVLGLYS